MSLAQPSVDKDPFLRRGDVLTEDLEIDILGTLDELWENAEDARDLALELKSDFRRLLKLRSGLK